MQRRLVTPLQLSGPIPRPEAPILAPTPDVIIAQRDEIRRNENRMCEAQSVTESGASGFFSSIGASLGAAVSDVKASTEDAARKEVMKTDLDRFAKAFPEIVAAGDQWKCDYACKIIEGAAAYAGHIIVTSRHLLFTSQYNSFILPLHIIASWRHSVSLPAYADIPVIVYTPRNVIPTAIQIFTSTGQMYQLYDIDCAVQEACTVGMPILEKRMHRAYDHFVNYLDHCWRAATPVPLPTVQYGH